MKKLNKPLVSIVVPICNVETYLEQCLNSLINQTYKNIEIICVNDGSTDRSIDILHKYAKKDDRILIITKVNSGYGQSMNIALDKARGKYISIVESDDFIELSMINDLVNLAEMHNLDLVRCNYNEYFNEHKIPHNNKWIDKNVILYPIKNKSFFFQEPAIWSNLIKRQILEYHNIRFLETPGASFQDTSFSFKLFYYSNRVLMTDKYLLNYRIDNNNSSVKSSKKVFFVNKEWREILQISKLDKYKYNEIKYLLFRLRHNCYLWNFKRLSFFSKLLFLFVWNLENLRDFIYGRIKFNEIKSSYRLDSILITFIPWVFFIKEVFYNANK